MIIRDYIPGEPLAENEYMLKLRDDKKRQWNTETHSFSDWEHHKTGFLSKLTQKGQMPKAFTEWGKPYMNAEPTHTYVFQEYPRSGWKIVSWRFGQSQNWATVRHPEGFNIEIYLQQLLEVIQKNNIEAGVLIGKFYWKDNKLFKEE
jgi:hypothetical protein